MQSGTTLPWASSLCGACYEACPVKIDIPSVLIHLRGRVVREAKQDGLRGRLAGEQLSMQALARVFSSRRRYEAAQKLAARGARPLSKDGVVEARLPGPLHGWLAVRDLKAPPPQSFRTWWREEHTP
jgi:L-lactate dehydrogenase complex protein LldF